MWTKVSATVSKGSTTLSLVDAVDWIVGDEIIITSTDFQTEQSERRFVTAVENTGAGSTVTIDLPLVYEHYGVTQEYFGFQVDMRAEVQCALLSFLSVNICRLQLMNPTGWSLIQQCGY